MAAPPTHDMRAYKKRFLFARSVESYMCRFTMDMVKMCGKLHVLCYTLMEAGE